MQNKVIGLLPQLFLLRCIRTMFPHDKVLKKKICCCWWGTKTIHCESAGTQWCFPLHLSFIPKYCDVARVNVVRTPRLLQSASDGRPVWAAQILLLFIHLLLNQIKPTERVLCIYMQQYLLHMWSLTVRSGENLDKAWKKMTVPFIKWLILLCMCPSYFLILCK